MESNDYFLANKCGYGQCCNVADKPNYINLGGFILQTRLCDEHHKEPFIKFIIALNRTISQDPVLNEIIITMNMDFINGLSNMIELANKEMPYELEPVKQEEEQQTELKNKKKFKDYAIKRAKEIKDRYEDQTE